MVYAADTTPVGGGSPAKFATGPMADIIPSKIEVYVNGQQLLSGSNVDISDAGGKVADYYVSAPQTIEFAFDLKANDVIIVRDRT